MFIKIKNSHQIILLAGKKYPMMLRINCHAMIALTTSDRVSCHYLVSRWIDDGEQVLILQVNVHFSCNRIVLRHSSLTVEMQSLDDYVASDIDNRFGLATFV